MDERAPDRRIDPAELLAAYELGLLDPDQCARLETATRDDPDLLLDLYDGAADGERLRAEPARFAAVLRSSLAAGRPGWVARAGRWWAAVRRPRVLVPVAAALAVGVFLLLPGDGGHDLRDLAQLEPLPASRSELRAAAPVADTAYGDALDRYLAHEWRAAAAGFAAALSAGGPEWPRRDQASLYLGSSLLLDGRTADAVGTLAPLVESPLGPVRERAAWQLVQAHLLEGDADTARALLATLRSSPVYGDRATDLLGRLPAAD